MFPARPAQLQALTSEGHAEASDCLSLEPCLLVVLAPGPEIRDGAAPCSSAPQPPSEPQQAEGDLC